MSLVFRGFHYRWNPCSETHRYVPLCLFFYCSDCELELLLNWCISYIRDSTYGDPTYGRFLPHRNLHILRIRLFPWVSNPEHIVLVVLSKLMDYGAVSMRASPSRRQPHLSSRHSWLVNSCSAWPQVACVFGSSTTTLRPSRGTPRNVYWSRTISSRGIYARRIACWKGLLSRCSLLCGRLKLVWNLFRDLAWCVLFICPSF